MPSTAIQCRLSPLSSTESASAHWIAAFAAMTRTTIHGRTYSNHYSHVNLAIVILREGGESRGTPVPATAIQCRLSPLSSTESASAHWISASAAKTRTTSHGRTYSNHYSHVNLAIFILREGGGSRGTPVPSTAIQCRLSPLSSTESARAHGISASAEMTTKTSRGRILMPTTMSHGRTYFNHLLQTYG